MDDLQPEDIPQQREARVVKRRSTPIVLRPAVAVPITDEDYQLAVNTLAAMMASWWHDQQKPPK
jgi:hypothetical protein